MPLLKRLHRIKFDRNELAGAFGDIGTDIPLLVGMLIASGMNGMQVLVIYGVLQLFSGIYYGIPMAVQPLKAVATLVIAQQLTSPLIAGGGLAIGVIMFLLTYFGILTWLADWINKVVIRGVQLGLGLLLANIAISKYILPEMDIAQLILIILLVATGVLFWKDRKWPASLFMIGIGVIYSLLIGNFSVQGLTPHVENVHWHLNQLKEIDILSGFVVLALPQIPLSIGNSILATKQLADDFFPNNEITVRKIGYTYSFMNIFSSFVGGIPVCHGSGGLAGHYSFGGRSGGSVVIYGILLILFGLLMGNNYDVLLKIFPLPVLGVILIFESFSLAQLSKDVLIGWREITTVLLVAIICLFVPYGFLFGLIAGVIVFKLLGTIDFLKHEIKER